MQKVVQFTGACLIGGFATVLLAALVSSTFDYRPDWFVVAGFGAVLGGMCSTRT